MENKVIYVPVSVQEELPEVSQDVFAFHDKDDWESQCFISPDDGRWYNTWADGDISCYPTHWLKRIDLPSKEELDNTFATLSEMSNGVICFNSMKIAREHILSIINPKKCNKKQSR